MHEAVNISADGREKWDFIFYYEYISVYWQVACSENIEIKLWENYERFRGWYMVYRYVYEF